MTLNQCFAYVWNGQIPTFWRLRFQSASSFHFAAPAVKYLPWQQPWPTARFQMPPASYQQQLPQPFCLFLFACNFEVWRFLSSNKWHRTNCQKFIKCLALKRVRSLDFGSFHDFEAPDFGKLPIDPTRVGFAGSNSRISLHFLHMVNWAGHYRISNWWFKRPPTCWHIFFFANACEGQKFSFGCNGCLLAHTVLLKELCSVICDVNQCCSASFPSWSAFWRLQSNS